MRKAKLMRKPMANKWKFIATVILFSLATFTWAQQKKKHKTDGQLAWESFEKQYNSENGRWGPCALIYGPVESECQIVKGTDRVSVRPFTKRERAGG